MVGIHDNLNMELNFQYLCLYSYGVTGLFIIYLVNNSEVVNIESHLLMMSYYVITEANLCKTV